MTLPKIASLWIGGNLSYLEQVCLKSFADHGHRTILYTYEGVTNAPEGVEVQDANLIFPNTNFMRHKESGSPAVHADAFRYRMIQLQDVIWVDADMLCVQPWDIPNKFVFGWEKKNRVVCNAVFGLPKFSRTLERLNVFCRDEYPIPPWLSDAEQDDLRRAAQAGNPTHVSELKWGVWGPSAVTHFLKETGEIEHAMPVEAFYPVSFKDRRKLIDPGQMVEDIMTDGVYGVHLWNRRLSRRIVTNENGITPEDGFLGRALVRHDIDPHLAPIPDKPPPGHPTQKEIAEGRGEKTAVKGPAPTRTKARETGAKKLDRLQQTAPYQSAIDGLEGRTEKLFSKLAPPAAPIPHDRIVILTAMKNEAPFILEWIAYHKMIGASHFLVYTNDCTDNTNDILDRLGEMGLVTRLDNPWDPTSNKKPQHVALADAQKQPVIQQADWVLTIDVDEFVNVHVGDGTFADLFAASNDPNVISFTWKFFGNKGIDTYQDRPITEQFVACAPEYIPKPRLGWGFKTMLHSTAPYTKIGVHRPLKIENEEAVGRVRWVNGSGRAMPEMLLTNNGWRSTKRSLGYRFATLNHYVLRSAESYLVKRDRGRINHTDQDQGISYWMRRNYTSEIDDRMMARQDDLQREIKALKDDATLGRLHQDAVAWHRKKIETLKADAGYATLFRQLTDVQWPDAIYLTKTEAETRATDDDNRNIMIPEPERNAMHDDTSAAKIMRLELMLSGDIPRGAGVDAQGNLPVKAPDIQPETIAVAGYDAWAPDPPASAQCAAPEPRFDSMRAKVAGGSGFFWEGEKNALYFEPGGKKLVVAFDNVHTARLEEQRWPWGHAMITQQLGCAVLGVLSKDRGWFRHDFVHDSFDRLQESGWFKQFDEVLFYGASMGGFGALTYARSCPGAHVLALEPQTTLDRDILPNDNRWPWTKKLNWKNRYGDASDGTAACNTVVVVSDPYFDMDRAHVKRLSGDNITHLRIPFFGHKVAHPLTIMGNLKPLLADMTRGTFDATQYYRLLRNRHYLPRFQHGIIQLARDKGHLKLALKACEFTLEQRKAPNIRLTKEKIEAMIAMSA
ncbi:glycosyltransferase family 2 protein [Roseobacter sp.]|uniref:glycosyltransferase family 2 protein n=1 Tax=Roseobacter sp. TaxID=1907202 RepID=UPI00329A00FC